VQTQDAEAQLARLSLLVLYLGIALSDFFDGQLARKAGAPSHVWGQVDAVADITFTSSSLAVAAWLGCPLGWLSSVHASSCATWAGSRHQKGACGRIGPAKPPG
jgi:phosphatidylglycerophosphate synthase